jgi:3-hydroxyacyl-CoA dehydrogenase/3a,7a,12a-trihydroxy-5b-cholest-24-enoyl-CoA hydratase
VSPLVAYLCHESSGETGGLFEVGGGFMAKLRWERAAGHTFKLSRPITPEGVRDRFTAIAGFDKTTHPADITASMQPILDNLHTARGRGGNEFIDVDAALGYEFPPEKSSYTERDLSLYALGVGAGQNPLDDRELRLVYELHPAFAALPTFAVVPALGTIFKLAQEGKQAPGLNYGLDRVLHGEQYTELRRPLPTRGQLTHKIRIKDIFDKGKNALVVSSITTTDESGQELCYNEVTTFVRGAGGWGGERGPSSDINTPPERAPDRTVTEKTSEGQALLYRLSGDWNPLHADPGFARNFGFPRPILHGLCTYGFAARHVISAFCDGDPRRLKSIKARFADSVFPGETLVTEMWRESDTRIIFRTRVKERDKVVISNAAVELWQEVPQAKVPPPAAKPEAKPAPAGGDFTLTSADVFCAIEDYLTRNLETAQKMNTTFLFKLTQPDSQWTIDAKGKVAVLEGAKGTPDVTLELSDADFLAMTQGKADPQKLYFGGKLKISGNIMASTKLEFLKKMDPQQALQAIVKKRGQAPAQPAPAPQAQAAAPAPAPVKEGRSPALFTALGERLAQSPGLAGEVGAVLQFRVKSPDRSYVVDLQQAPGAVSEGEAQGAQATFTLSDDDLVALAQDPGRARDLYQRGRLRVDGDVRLAQRLAFLKGLA